ncbi:MAG: restriction endonuclease subunit S [Candidatus Methanoperedens sp.]|nr:restriction endonuclease subunit S [Candidatus Methanoperedens sp.]MCE8428452.1 restriction endonuclease subunit S [Candidatus Methanoperedens sp.]
MSIQIVPETPYAPARRWKPYAEYKDSGVEWLREIPMGWNVNRIKFTSYVKGRVGWHGLRSDEFTDVGPFLVTGTDFSNGKINWETCHHFSEERYNEDPYIQLKENDLLITKDGTIGKVAIVEKLSGKASLNSGIMLIRPLKQHYMKEFMFWVLKQVPLFSTFIRKHLKTFHFLFHHFRNSAPSPHSSTSRPRASTPSSQRSGKASRNCASTARRSSRRP